MPQGDDGRRAQAHGTDTGDAQWHQQLTMTAPQDQPAAEQQQQGHAQANGQQGEQQGPVDHPDVDASEGQPYQHRHADRQTPQFEGVAQLVIAVLPLQRRRETQAAIAARQLLGIGAGMDVGQPVGVERHQSLTD